MSDRIYLDDLSVPCTIGISAAERRKPQEVIVSISIFMDLRKAAKRDSVTETADYRKVRQKVSETAARGRFRLLESLSEAIASAVLESFPADRVVVNVRKAKYASRPAIGVEIERKARRVA